MAPLDSPTAVADAVLVYHRERLGDGVGLITIDLDATDDPTHVIATVMIAPPYLAKGCSTSMA